MRASERASEGLPSVPDRRRSSGAGGDARGGVGVTVRNLDSLLVFADARGGDKGSFRVSGAYLPEYGDTARWAGITMEFLRALQCL